MYVYLAGPINGCTDDEALTWRDTVRYRVNATCIDPMRRDYRGREDECVNDIVEMDKKDIDRADIVLANCWQVSWGTAMEILYAWEHRKRVIAVVPDGVRVSPWLRYHAEVMRSLDEALRILPESSV
jgi:nucleoside 2-deoxyribosyltransferase